MFECLPDSCITSLYNAPSLTPANAVTFSKNENTSAVTTALQQQTNYTKYPCQKHPVSIQQYKVMVSRDTCKKSFTQLAHQESDSVIIVVIIIMVIVSL